MEPKGKQALLVYLCGVRIIKEISAHMMICYLMYTTSAWGTPTSLEADG